VTWYCSDLLVAVVLVKLNSIKMGIELNRGWVKRGLSSIEVRFYVFELNGVEWHGLQLNWAEMDEFGFNGVELQWDRLKD
jgi:hypothetical protein